MRMRETPLVDADGGLDTGKASSRLRNSLMGYLALTKPRVIELLAREKGWGPLRRRREAARVAEFLASFKGGGEPPAVLVAREKEKVKGGG